jgi:peptidoglycan hydrolase-like protein with peptidoglycan-binding domain
MIGGREGRARLDGQPTSEGTMPLVSLLLRDEPRLQACLVADTAHVVPGATGRHVVLIQKVLLVLEKAPISAGELRSGVYGPTTAAAVLAYKRKRNIVNRAYQTTADNIVGKMTIAKMDNEILLLDQRAASGRVVCTSGGQAPPARSAIVGADQPGLVGGPTPFKPKKQRPARLRIIVQKTNRASEFGDANGLLAELYKRARELLAPHGMDFTTGATTPIFGPEVIDSEKVIAGSAGSCGGVMESALRALADRPDTLRVIFSPFSDTGDAFGVTDGGPESQLKTLPRFCLINVRKRRGDLGTLLHEMVHAAKPEKVLPDADINSVFSEADNRNATQLPEKHAESIATSFFGK